MAIDPVNGPRHRCRDNGTEFYAAEVRFDATLDRVRVRLDAAAIIGARSGPASDGWHNASPSPNRTSQTADQDVHTEPVVQRLDDRPYCVPVEPGVDARGDVADLCLDRVERHDTHEHFRRKRRLRRRVELEEDSRLICRPTKCQVDRLIGAIARQALEAVIAVDLQNTLKPDRCSASRTAASSPHYDWVLSNRWVGRTAPWTVIDRIAPPGRPVLVRPRPGSSAGRAGVVGKDLRRQREPL